MLSSPIIIYLLGISSLWLVQPLSVKEPVVSETSVRLGKRSVIYKTTCYRKREGVVFINLHQNETTSVKAATNFLDSINRFCLIELNSGNNRNLYFNVGRIPYQADPNRMFSEKGIRASLRALNKNYTETVVKRLMHHSNTVQNKFIRKQKLIIALHNNTNENLSVLSFIKGGDEEEYAAKVHVNSDRDADDFFYTTNETFYEELVSRNYNVVLEKKSVNDDGSLSVYCNRSGIPYINVEAEHDHLNEQMEMLMVLNELISGFLDDADD